MKQIIRRKYRAWNTHKCFHQDSSQANLENKNKGAGKQAIKCWVRREQSAAQRRQALVLSSRNSSEGREAVPGTPWAHTASRGKDGWSRRHLQGQNKQSSWAAIYHRGSLTTESGPQAIANRLRITIKLTQGAYKQSKKDRNSAVVTEENSKWKTSATLSNSLGLRVSSAKFERCTTYCTGCGSGGTVTMDTNTEQVLSKWRIWLLSLSLFL